MLNDQHALIKKSIPDGNSPLPNIFNLSKIKERTLNNLLIKQLKTAVAVIAVLALASCGEGGGGGNKASSTIPATYRGQFVDANVAGLNWQTATRTGTTDANGYFEYDTQGETVTFSINNVQLGTVNADQTVHVFDLEQSQYDQSSNKGARIAQLLQTLDSDSDATNGIQLTPEVKAKFAQTTAIDFYSEPTAWDAQIATVASNAGKPVVPMDVAYAHASSNVNTSANCAIPVKNYHIDGTIGNFSSEKLNCSQRANLEAFVYDVAPFMVQQERVYRDLIVSKYSDENTDEFVKNTLQNNAAKATLTVAIETFSLAKLTPDETKALVASSAKLTNSMLAALCTKISCDAAGSEKGLKVISFVVAEIANASSCYAKNLDDCGKFVIKILESAYVAEKLGIQLTSNDAKEISAIVITWLKAGTNIFDTANGAPRLNAVGTLVEASIKTTKIVSAIDDKTISALVDTTAEALNAGITCRTAYINPVECVDKAANYMHDKILTTFLYVGLSWQLSDILQQANEYKVARLVLAEQYKNGGLIQAYEANGIAYSANFDRHHWRLAADQLFRKIALANDALPLIESVSFFDNVLDHIQFNQNSVQVYAARYADGSYGSCRNVTVTDPIPDGMVNYPYFANPGQNLTYTASGTGSISQYVFNWGDGTYTYSDLPAAQHIFDRAGYYGVTITPVVKKISGETQVCKTAGSSGISIATQQITSVTPSVASVDIPVTITIKGANLPLTSVLAMTDAICDVTPTSRTTTGFKVNCVPKGALGNKTITIKDAPGGNIIDASRSINMVQTAPSPNPLTIDSTAVGTTFNAPTGATSCTFTATGTWSPGIRFGSVNAAGSGPTAVGYTYPLASAYTFSLIAKLPDGSYQYIGSTQAVAVSGGTGLTFLMNDSMGDYADNSGALSVAWQCNTPAPTITTITPATASIGQATTFTVTGQNLPLTAVMSIAEGVCQTPTNNTPTGFTVVCTPGGVAGSKIVTIKTDTLANGGTVVDESKSISVSTSTTGQQLVGTWSGWDGASYTAAEVVSMNGYLTKKTSNWLALRLHFAPAVNGDDFSIALRAKNDPALIGATPAYDLNFGVNNQFSTGQFNVDGSEKATRAIAFVGTNGYFSDFFVTETSTGSSGWVYQPGAVVNTTIWHDYILSAKNNVLQLYVDGNLMHSQTYTGTVGLLDTLWLSGKNNLQIDNSSLTVSVGK